MVKKITNALNQQNSITGASVILVITLFLSNVLGVFRDHFLTQKIPTEQLSAYYAAFRIPDLIFNILILGAIASAFIPVFTTLLSQKKDKEAWMVASSVINIAIIFLVGLAVILFFLMGYLIPYIVPGFNADYKDLTVKLARIMLLSPIFFGLSYIFGGILNSFKRFLVYSLAPLVYNLTIILGTLIFADKYSVVGVAYAVVAGAFLHLFIQVPPLLKTGFIPRLFSSERRKRASFVGALFLRLKSTGLRKVGACSSLAARMLRNSSEYVPLRGGYGSGGARGGPFNPNVQL